MKKIKKVLAIILCIVTLMSFTIMAGAVSEKYGFLYGRIDNSDVLEIVGISSDGELADAQTITVPSYLNGLSVVQIGQSAFINNTTVQNITLTKNILEISDNAMYGMSALKSITLPENLMIMGEKAFAYCSALENVNFETRNLSEIQSYTFYGCTKLNDVVLPDCVFEIGEYAFAQCMSLDNIYIPSSVGIIADTAFYSTKNGFTIYGYRGSYAYRYALKNSIPFVDMKEKAFADLDEMIIQAENQMAVSFRYTESSVNDLEEAIRQAKAVQNDSSSTEKQAKDMTQILEQYLNILTEVTRYDVNLDGKITLSDIVMLNKRFISNYDFTQRDIYIADFNNDNKITLADIVLFQRYILIR